MTRTKEQYDDDCLRSLEQTFSDTRRRQRVTANAIADDIVWELAYASAIGHPARLSGREEVVPHVIWFLGAVEDFRFFDLRVYPFADPEGAVAEVKAEARIKTTGRIYHQDYVLFLRAAGRKITFLREYFDPARAAQALDTPILGLES
jgi:ketosteroid isomerase-like protein